MAARRALIVLIVVLVAAGLGALLLRVLSPGGWTLPKAMMLLAFAGTAPWTGLCVANGLIGFLVLVFAAHPPASRERGGGPRSGPTEEGEALPHIAIALTIRNEDMRAVLPPLAQLLRDLDRSGVGRSFAVFVLSDTQDLRTAVEEEQAVAAFRAADRMPTRIHYRRRTGNDGFKAGNIMHFLDHHAEGFELMLTLDADSAMSGDAVMRLVHAMRTDPSLGIVQHLTVGRPASAAFPRLFQFGMRAGMRTWTTGQDWWQGDEGPYWGHNALIRIAPFRAHCRLPLLPDERHILSHDQVEAVMLRAAGWGVRVLPEESGSTEINPPALPEFLRRELRWLAGNLQYRHLLRLRGLRPMGRWQLIQAILLFTGTPLYLLFLLAAALAAAIDATSQFPAGPALALTVAWLGALYAPKLLGYAEVAVSPTGCASYGGLGRFTVGALAEIGFTLLLDAVSAVAKTLAMLRLSLGARTDWSPQSRGDRGVGWHEAIRLLWPQTALGVVVFAAFASAGWSAVLWALPLAGGLLAAIPLCVVTADPRFGDWLRRHMVAAIPEEIVAGPQSDLLAPVLALLPQGEPDCIPSAEGD